MSTATAPLPVFVVEEHCEALLCLHRCMRRGVLPLEGSVCVHFDAHPDLSLPPDLDARLVFQPRALLQKLRETDSGIAEWMLPLVFAGHVSRIVWVRPPWSYQIDDGEFAFHVGSAAAPVVPAPAQPAADNASGDDADGDEHGELRWLAVDCPAPYFTDDGIYVPSSRLADAKPLSLQVCCLQADTNTDVDKCVAHAPVVRVDCPNRMRLATAPRSPARASPIILDICLDYFTTLNPFVEELRQHLSRDDISLVTSVYLSPYQRRQGRRRTGKADEVDWSRYAWDERTTKAAFEEIFSCALFDEEDPEKLLSHRRMQALLSLMVPPPAHDVDVVRARGLLLRFCSLLRRLGNHRGAEVKLAAVRNCISWCGLPHHVSTRDEMNAMVQRMAEEVRLLPRSPAVVTIACSATDGFLPTKDVTWLIKRILQELRRTDKLDVMPDADVLEAYPEAFNNK